jgi:Fe-S oxidoreductase
LAPFLPNGKPLQVQGFLPAFNKAARNNARQLQDFARHGVSLVGLDPAMTLVYRQEYQKVEGVGTLPRILLPQEWLLEVFPTLGPAALAAPYSLLGHCTEKTNVPGSTDDWVSVFGRAGLQLQARPSGCCGMSGTYGHETRNVATSRTIFEQSWAKAIDACEEHELLATGYSCRSQVARMRAKRLRHPIEVLLDCVRLNSPAKALA